MSLVAKRLVGLRWGARGLTRYGIGRSLVSARMGMRAGVGSGLRIWQSDGGRKWMETAADSLVTASGSGVEKEGTPFLLADIGEGISEVEILRWFVNEGDTVTQFQKLVEVQSDKATVDITSRFDGRIQTLSYGEGEIAKVGTPLCIILNENSTSTAASSGDKEKTKKDVTSESKARKKPLASPPVRQLAKEMSVDLALLSGRGPEGRILREDVQQYVEDRDSSAKQSQDKKEFPKTPGALMKSFTQRSFTEEQEETTEPIRGLQRAMVKSMTSALNVPHLNLGEEICMDNLVNIKNSVASWAMDRHQVKVTFLPFLLKATSLALTYFPILNSRVDENCENIIYQKWHNISVAMDTPHGLVVPNVKKVQKLSVLDIARELQRLGEETKTGHFKEEDLANGTFAISNVGSIAGTYTSPVLMVPQVAIGALGRIQKLPRFDENGDVTMKRIAHVTWAADHRIIDGATIANFSNLFRRHVENPYEMLLELR